MEGIGRNFRNLKNLCLLIENFVLRSQERILNYKSIYFHIPFALKILH